MTVRRLHVTPRRRGVAAESSDPPAQWDLDLSGLSAETQAMILELRRRFPLADKILQNSVSARTLAEGGPTQVAWADPARCFLYLYNNGAASIYYGGSNVTAGGLEDPNGGIPLFSQSGIVIPSFIGALWVATGTDRQDVRVQSWIDSSLDRGGLARRQT